MTDEHLQATVSVRGVIIEPRGQLLVLQRATDTEWELPGGRLSSNEAPLQGLHRELTEETALSVEIGGIVAANSWVNTDDQDRFAVHYRCYASHRQPTLSDEHIAAQWVDRADATDLLRESQTVAVQAATGAGSTRSEPVTRSSASPE